MADSDEHQGDDGTPPTTYGISGEARFPSVVATATLVEEADSTSENHVLSSPPPPRTDILDNTSTKTRDHSLELTTVTDEPARGGRLRPYGVSGEESSNQGSFKTEYTHPTPVVTAVVGLTTTETPSTAGDEENCFSTKQRADSLQFYTGEPAPNAPDPNRYGQIAGEVTDGAIPENPRTGSVKQTNQSLTDNHESSRGFFGRMTRLHWALAGAVVLIVVLLIVVIVVVVSPRNDGVPAVVVETPSGGDPVGDSTNESNNPQPTNIPVTPPPAPSPTLSPTTVAPTISTSTDQPTVFTGSPTLEEMMVRGVLLCGITPGLSGFSLWNGETYEGFEADLCRSLAAAALGSPENVQFVEVEAEDMFVALQNGSVDVLASHVTLTMARTVFEDSAQAGFTFSVPYLYDGLTFGGSPQYVDCADRLNTTGNCADLRICALLGSTHAATVLDLIGTLVASPSMESLYQTFDEGFCDVIAGDQFEVAEGVVRTNGYTGEYQVGENLHSHDPLSLVTRNDDARWSDMVQWVVQALLAAEEQNVTMTAAESFADTEFFGDSFKNLFRNAISAVGSYGEMYARHLESIVPRKRINTINTEGDSGLRYSFPFGSLETNGPGPTEGGTLKRIRDRNVLRCGITLSPGFAKLDAAGIWRGLDADFCRAVAAAIFDGVTDNIDFRVLPGTERFTALANGDVDVLSRTTTWTFQRDVMEPTSGVGFSFSQPTFYDHVAVGGTPPYGICADILETSSSICEDLKLCVVDGTTTIQVAGERFPGSVIVPKLTHEEVIAGLSNGDCNAIIGIGLQLVESSVRDFGYTGAYETGQRYFSKEPLCMVTREDDPQFTAFVNLIVTATFFAEEQEGITQSTGNQMPQVSLFGPLYGRMLKNVVEAVGTYGEIYARSVEEYIPRAGLNTENQKPYGPQHYSLFPKI